MNDAQIRLECVRFSESAAAKGVEGLSRPDLLEGTRRFLVSCYRDAGAAPHRMDGDALREILETHLPRRCFASAAFVPAMEDLVDAYFSHLEEQRLVAQIFEIRRALAETRGTFAAAVKAVPESERRLDEEPVAPIARPNVKVGRNDPCPCGSGKKYKQCCQRLGS
jgi:hypothetical protein